MAAGQALIAAQALTGTTAFAPVPQEDGPQAAAVWAVAEVMLEGNPGGIGTKFYSVKATGNVVIGYKNIPNKAKNSLTSIWYLSDHHWSGLQYR